MTELRDAAAVGLPSGQLQGCSAKERTWRRRRWIVLALPGYIAPFLIILRSTGAFARDTTVPVALRSVGLYGIYAVGTQRWLAAADIIMAAGLAVAVTLLVMRKRMPPWLIIAVLLVTLGPFATVLRLAVAGFDRPANGILAVSLSVAPLVATMRLAGGAAAGRKEGRHAGPFWRAATSVALLGPALIVGGAVTAVTGWWALWSAPLEVADQAVPRLVLQGPARLAAARSLCSASCCVWRSSRWCGSAAPASGWWS